MNITALRGFVGENGKNISIGDKLSVSDAFAKQLIKAGKAEQFIEPVKQEPIKKSKKFSEHTVQKLNIDVDDTIVFNINQNHNEDDAHYEDNIVVNSDNNNSVNEINVADINTQNNSQYNNAKNAIIIQKNVAGKK